MNFINSVQIDASQDIPELDRVRKQMTALILSAEGGIPGSRGFGLSREFLSQPPEEAVNEFGIELQEKMERYIDRVEISDVDADYSRVMAGGVDITVHVIGREADEE